MALLLRNIKLDDVDLYVARPCDPVMMAELGGPLPREGIEAVVAPTADYQPIRRPGVYPKELIRPTLYVQPRELFPTDMTGS